MQPSVGVGVGGVPALMGGGPWRPAGQRSRCCRLWHDDGGLLGRSSAAERLALVVSAAGGLLGRSGSEPCEPGPAELCH